MDLANKYRAKDFIYHFNKVLLISAKPKLNSAI